MIVDGLWEPFKVPIRPVKRPIAKRYGRFFARGYASRSAAFATLRLHTPHGAIARICILDSR